MTSKFALRIWCPDCYGVDPNGCFGGKTAYVTKLSSGGDEVFFDTPEEAAAVAICLIGGGIWDFAIYPVKDDGTVDLANPLSDSEIDWSRVRVTPELKQEVDKYYFFGGE